MITCETPTPVLDAVPTHSDRVPRSAKSAEAIARTQQSNDARTAPAASHSNGASQPPTHVPTNGSAPVPAAAVADNHRTNAQSVTATEDATDTAPRVSEKDLVQVFKLLADETRLKILLSLQREGELHVSALCARLGQSQPAVSHHLALLRDADLIRPRRDGKHNYYSVRREHFQTVMSGLFSNIFDDASSDV